MSFKPIAELRQSCRHYDPTRMIEDEKIDEILSVARLAPSACNGQPYAITVCRGEVAKQVALATRGPGLNKFASDAPILLVISERAYVATAALGAKLKHNDYRSIDIGILSAYITAEAASLGLGSCILGWFDEKEIQALLETDEKIRLVITIGYAGADEKIREKKRKPIDELVRYKG